MKAFFKLYLLCFSIFFVLPLNGQAHGEYSEYYILRKNYEGLSENDPHALQFIRQYITKAKKEKDYQHLVQGYLDGILYSPSPYQKLKFADSTIYASKLTGDNEKISAAYLEKGVVYYFQFKKYNLALDEYLKAYKFSKDIKDDFYKNRLIYLMGVVNSYTGNYVEALEQFKVTSGFFKKETKKPLHPNILYNNFRGYFNSIHQMAVCYRNLGQFKKADSIVAEGLYQSASSKEYMQEYGYFLKEKGIQQFRNKQYDEAISSINSSIKSISAVNDFAWVTVCYAYIGKSYLAQGKDDFAITYFKLVDSVFQKHHFVLPEVRNNYESLIDYYKSENNLQKQYFYTTQLIKADSVLNKDFRYLTSKIHKEYDTPMLLETKLYLEKKISQGKKYTLLIIAFCIFILLFIIIRYKKKQDLLIKNYNALEQKILNKDVETSKDDLPKVNKSTNPYIPPHTIDDILKKLEKFEQNNGFVVKGLTSGILAKQFETNSKYLTVVIKQYKGMNFPDYLTRLRITNITEKLYNDKKYLSYTLETLAEECGIVSRDNFNKKFAKINKLKPADFIKQRRKALKLDDDPVMEITV
ncbi:helix-turn-helix domain-containing protein [Chryseobacterium sp. DT-3]|uniref:helix-turn-helix domain-containing protein n=1 Tax=Chryseobacterium sp. DT-3 TaxID=3396164 RepID=UPI003F198BDA